MDGILPDAPGPPGHFFSVDCSVVSGGQPGQHLHWARRICASCCRPALQWLLSPAPNLAAAVLCAARRLGLHRLRSRVRDEDFCRSSNPDHQLCEIPVRRALRLPAVIARDEPPPFVVSPCASTLRHGSALALSSPTPSAWHAAACTLPPRLTPAPLTHSIAVLTIPLQSSFPPSPPPILHLCPSSLLTLGSRSPSRSAPNKHTVPTLSLRAAQSRAQHALCSPTVSS